MMLIVGDFSIIFSKDFRTSVPVLFVEIFDFETYFMVLSVKTNNEVKTEVFEASSLSFARQFFKMFRNVARLLKS